MYKYQKYSALTDPILVLIRWFRIYRLIFECLWMMIFVFASFYVIYFYSFFFSFSNFVTYSMLKLPRFLFIRTNSSFKQNVYFFFHIFFVYFQFYFISFSMHSEKLRLFPTLWHFRYISMFLILMNKEENERKNDNKRWKQMFSYKLMWCRVAVVCLSYSCVFFSSLFRFLYCNIEHWISNPTGCSIGEFWKNV